MRNQVDKPSKTSQVRQERNKKTVNTAKPIHVRRVEKALDLKLFLNSWDNRQFLSSSDSDEDDIPDLNNINIENILKDGEPHSPKDYYNFKSISTKRKWLADVLQENSDNTPDDAQYKHILRMHAYQKKLRKSKENFDNYMYYGAGLVSAIDKYPEIEKTVPTQVKKPVPKTLDTTRSPLYHPEILENIPEEPCLDLSLQNGMEYQGIDDLEDANLMPDYSLPGPSHQPAHPLPPRMSQIVHPQQQPAATPKKKNKKFRDEESRKKWEDMMTVKRRKLFTNIVKKEIGKQHRSKINRHKEMLLQCKRIASHCAKYARQKAVSKWLKTTKTEVRYFNLSK